MIPAQLRVGLAKELGALLPTWLTALAAVAAGVLLGGGLLATPGLLAFVIGSALLGAQAIGHEYTCGTIGMLLAQPVDRRRLYAGKLAALAMLLLLLAAAASALVLKRPELVRGWTGLHPLTLLAVAPLAFSMAPVLTMLTRGVLPGAVFTIAVPVVLLAAGDLTGLAMHGPAAAAQIDAVRLAVFWWGLGAACVLATIASWRMFVRLEALDAGHREVQMPVLWRHARGRGPARPHPLLLLAGKELRVQQMTFVVAALYAGVALIAASVESMTPGTAPLSLTAITPLYVLILPQLAGALASAEERQLGTLEWQVLLPVASSRQWAVKAGVALGSALLLALGLPLLLARVHPAAALALPGAPMWQLAILIVVLTSCGLYVSSFTRSGVKALMATLGLLLLVALAMTTTWVLVSLLPAQSRSAIGGLFRADAATYRVLTSTVILTTSAGLVAAMMRFGLVNHRTAGHARVAIVGQIALLMAILAAGAVLLQVVEIAMWPRR